MVPAAICLLTMIVVGTIVPFLLVAALRQISATRVALTAMFEPVAGAIVAYAWLGGELSSLQIQVGQSSWPGS